MENKPGSVVLIFRKIESRWRDEHPLNLLAAFATRSQYSHVEISIGDEAGQHGEIRNVLRIFNDDIGVEVAQRTGRSPSFHYVQLGCSLASEQAMLRFAHNQVGKPFSMRAMVRSIVWPRTTDQSSWFCAELVAATLQKGGLYPTDENPGAATPESLYRRFISQATTTGNPCMMRSILPNASHASHVTGCGQSMLQERQEQVNPLLKHCNITLGGTLASPNAPPRARGAMPAAHANQGPPRQQFHQQHTQHVATQFIRQPYGAIQAIQAIHPAVRPGSRPGCAQIAGYAPERYLSQPALQPLRAVRSNAEEAIRLAVRRANIQELSSRTNQNVVTLDIR